MDDLKMYRSKIDEIDKKLVELFEMRLDVVKGIERVKYQAGLPIVNKLREAEVIENSINHLNNMEYNCEIKIFMEKVIEITTNMQKKSIHEKGK